MAEQNNRGGFTPPARKKNGLDNKKLNLSAPCPTAPGKTSALIWGVYASNPRITVYTGDPEDSSERTGYGRIAASLDAPTFEVFLNMLKEAVDSTVEYKNKIENLNYTWFGGKRSENPVVVSSLWVGKDKDGLVWISVTAENRPLIKFIINNPEYHNLFHGDGVPFTKAEASTIYGKAYVKLLSGMMTHLLVSDYVEPEPKKPNAGSGGYQKQGGGGYNKPQGGGNNQASFGVDIPF